MSTFLASPLFWQYWFYMVTIVSLIWMILWTSELMTLFFTLAIAGVIELSRKLKPYLKALVSVCKSRVKSVSVSFVNLLSAMKRVAVEKLSRKKEMVVISKSASKKGTIKPAVKATKVAAKKAKAVVIREPGEDPLVQEIGDLLQKQFGKTDVGTIFRAA